MDLAVEVFRAFNDCKEYSLRDQVQKSAISITSNISEGFEKNSSKEFVRFLYIAKGSCGELRTQLYLARELKLLPDTTVSKFLDTTKKISGMLHNLIKTRKERFQ